MTRPVRRSASGKTGEERQICRLRSVFDPVSTSRLAKSITMRSRLSSSPLIWITVIARQRERLDAACLSDISIGDASDISIGDLQAVGITAEYDKSLGRAGAARASDQAPDDPARGREPGAGRPGDGASRPACTAAIAASSCWRDGA